MLLLLCLGIDFQQVSFRYPSRPDTEVLKGISFQVEPGSVVALVGPSGGGKSTVVNMIERFYSPVEGRIFLGEGVFLVSGSGLITVLSSICVV